MRDIGDELKIIGQGLLALFAFVVLSLVFSTVDFGINFNPFQDILTITSFVVGLSLLAIFTLFVIWIIKEFFDFFNWRF